MKYTLAWKLRTETDNFWRTDRGMDPMSEEKAAGAVERLSKDFPNAEFKSVPA